MQVDLVVLTSVTGTIVGIVAGAYGMKKSSDNDAKSRTEERVALSTKLDFVLQNLADIKIDIKSQDNSLKDINARLIKVEESSKVAHHRLDTLENKMEDEDK